MKQTLSYLIAISLILLAAVAASAPTRQDLNQAENLTVSFLRGEPQLAREYFSPGLQQRISLERLVQMRELLLEQGGGLRYIQAAYSQSPESPDNSNQAAVPVDLERFSAEVLITWQGALEKGAVTSFTVRPMSKYTRRRLPNKPNFTFIDADYVTHSRFQEFQVSAGPQEYLTPHRLVLPKFLEPNQRVPGVVFLPDRTMTDPDGTVGQTKMFRDLAYGLGSEEVASVRFLPRVKAYPELQDGVYTPDEAVLLDAEIALRLLLARPEVDPERIYVFGHGFGAAAAPELARRLPGIHGLIMATPPAEYDPEYYVRKKEREGAFSDMTEKQVSVLKGSLSFVKDRSVPPEDRVFDTPAGFFFSMREMQPEPLLRRFEGPVLLLFGGRDYMVGGPEYQIWGDLSRQKDNIHLRYFPTLNRWLMPSRGEGGPEEANRPSHVAPEILDMILQFLEGTTPAKQHSF